MYLWYRTIFSRMPLPIEEGLLHNVVEIKIFTYLLGIHGYLPNRTRRQPAGYHAYQVTVYADWP